MRLLLLGMVMSLALVACVKQSTYDGALAENRQLRAALASKDAELGAVKRENDAIGVVLAEMRRQVQRADVSGIGDAGPYERRQVLAPGFGIRGRIIETKHDEVPAYEPSRAE